MQLWGVLATVRTPSALKTPIACQSSAAKLEMLVSQMALLSNLLGMATFGS